METVARKASDVIREVSREVKLGTRTYKVHPFNLATWIEISALISECPEIDKDTDNIVKEMLSKAKDTKKYATILSTAILGVRKRRGLFSSVAERRDIKRHDELTNYITNEVTMLEYSAAFSACMKGSEVADFFSVGTFLTGINLLSPTKRINQIPYGPPLQDSPRTTT